MHLRVHTHTLFYTRRHAFTSNIEFYGKDNVSLLYLWEKEKKKKKKRNSTKKHSWRRAQKREDEYEANGKKSIFF